MRWTPDPEPRTPDIRSPGRYLRWLLADARWPFLLSFVYGIIGMLAQALVPAALGWAIEAGIIARDPQALVLGGGVVLGLGVVFAFAGILRDRSALISSLGAAYKTMQFVTRHVSKLGATLPRRVSAGEVVTVSVSDIGQIRNALDIAAARGAGAVIAIVVVGILMLRASWQLGLVVLIGVPLMAWTMGQLIRPLHRRQHLVRDQQAELTSRVVDIVNGLRVLRGIGGEQMFAERYQEESQRVRRAGVHLARIEALLDGAKVLLPGLLTTLVVWLGSRYVLRGQLSVGQLIAFFGYAVFLASPLRRVTDAAERLAKGYVAARRVTQFLSLEPEIAAGARDRLPRGVATLADPASGLVVTPGRLTAVVCTPSGDAEALADRLGRYTESGVTYGGIPLSELAPDEVRTRILVAGNDARLFSGPLRVELDPAGRAAGADHLLEAAIEAASARDIVEGLPHGLDESIASGGRDLSGGQQQRLRLVRALMFDPEVLILVEPTSAVDAHTEARIAQRLRASRAGRATLVFTTSPIILDQADHVVYMDRMQRVAEGTHGELLADARYRAIVVRQQSVAA